MYSNYHGPQGGEGGARGSSLFGVGIPQEPQLTVLLVCALVEAKDLEADLKIVKFVPTPPAPTTAAYPAWATQLSTSLGAAPETPMPPSTPSPTPSPPQSATPAYPGFPHTNTRVQVHVSGGEGAALGDLEEALQLKFVEKIEVGAGPVSKGYWYQDANPAA